MEFAKGQRVLASFAGEAPHVGVVSGPAFYDQVPVQFQPCGAHFSCASARVSAYGTRDGWTDQEYRTERESAYCRERAATVERERRERYPDAPFSAYRGGTA